MARKPLYLSIDPNVRDEFDKVAAGDNVSGNELAKLIIGKFSQLKQGTALDALASIPKDFFKLRPGRPPSGPVGSDRNASQATA